MQRFTRISCKYNKPLFRACREVNGVRGASTAASDNKVNRGVVWRQQSISCYFRCLGANGGVVLGPATIMVQIATGKPDGVPPCGADLPLLDGSGHSKCCPCCFCQKDALGANQIWRPLQGVRVYCARTHSMNTEHERRPCE